MEARDPVVRCWGKVGAQTDLYPFVLAARAVNSAVAVVVAAVVEGLERKLIVRV